MSNPIDEYAKTLATSWTVLLVVAVAVGGVGGLAVQSASGQQSDTVAVVTLDSTIITGSTADTTARTLRSLRTNESVDAVVLRIASPGGSVAGSEAQYRAVKRLAQQKPVVASVRGYAASGGYYSIAPTDHIFVTPSSMVGSVGVLTTIPENDRAPSQWKSAPDKGTAGPSDAARARATTFKRSFVSVVMNERGDELTVNRTTVSRAKLYAGNRAVKLGFADEVGGLEAAIRDAAERAGVEHYEVTYHNPSGGSILSLLSGANASGSAEFAPALCGAEYLALAPQVGPDLEVIRNASC
ncbi:MAG: S49 family peptidase [Halobacterium sp.]